MEITPAHLPSREVRTYEFGVRIDRKCIAAIEEQIDLSHRLFNRLIELMRSIKAMMNAYVIE